MIRTWHTYRERERARESERERERARERESERARLKVLSRSECLELGPVSGAGRSCRRRAAEPFTTTDRWAAGHVGVVRNGGGGDEINGVPDGERDK